MHKFLTGEFVTGTATTAPPHCGYFVPAIKIAQLLAAGCEMTILLADIHAFLDNLKAPIEMVEQRAEYYRFMITAILEAVGISTDKLRFVLGSSYQKTPDYVMDVYRMASVVSEHDARRAGSETVKQSANPPLSGLLYPVLQILDEQYLDVDAQFGGTGLEMKAMVLRFYAGMLIPLQAWIKENCLLPPRNGYPSWATESALT